MYQYLTTLDPVAKVVSTQPMILGLDFEDVHQVITCPDIKEAAFLSLPKDGFRYLVIGPQAYVSWTESGVSFSGKLGGFLRFFDKNVKPLHIFPHLNNVMLERFVFEHNQNLLSSIAFLDQADDHVGERRVYDIVQGLELMKTELEKRKKSIDVVK